MTANRIHPTAVVGPEVELGEGNVIGPYAVILGPCSIGSGNWVGPHAVIGTPPEVRGAPHPPWDEPEESWGIRIGDRNIIREHASIEHPLLGQTAIGDDCYVMTKAYVAHDCLLEDGVTLSGGVMVGGHCRIGRGANLGFGAVIHQRLVIGPGTMVGMGSVVTKPIPPFATAYGNPARVRSANRVGMARAGIPDEAIEAIDTAFRSGGVPEVHPDVAGAFAWYGEALAG